MRIFMSEKNPVVPVILSGGSGTRLWPRSRKHYPKQLLKIAGPYSMLQETVRRVAHLGAPMVVCNEDQRFLVAEQISELAGDADAIMLEPLARNTAPAIALAALRALQQHSDPILVVLPADHLIQDDTMFREALERAISRAGDGRLVVFGVQPDKAETGYGYIRAEASGEQGAAVSRFVEKPDAATAEDYLASGDYFWNSGMFVFKASVFIEELTRLEPDIVACCRSSLELAKVDLDFIRLDRGALEPCASESIDYAVMERTERAWMVPLAISWSDLGSWSSIWEVMEKDEDANVKLGDVLTEDCSGCLFHAEDHLIAAIGVKDLVVVDTKDALLISTRDRVQEVKKLVSQLEEQGREEHLVHREVYRPWGSYDAVDSGERYQVKRISVKPGQSLSLQMHHHRAEHWVVVQGTADVQVGDEHHILSENQSIYIPLGEKHRLSNPGKMPLYLIEVQSGSYLGEDDIVRYEDTYGRA
jgi:mannose-1-phosphate guanylyltransferase/mannose-6-phosphate isomerase